MALDCDQSHVPVWGLSTRLGSAAGLKVMRRSTSPSGVCAALYCGRLASWVATLTTSAGRTKLNSVCCPSGAAIKGAANSRAKRAGSVRIIRTRFSQTADDWPDDSDEIDHRVGESAHGGLRNFAPERRQGIEDRLAIALGNQATVEQGDGAAVFFGTQQTPAGLHQLQ